MFFKRIMGLLAAAVCLLSLAVPALGAQTGSDEVYCFAPGDFALSQEPVEGICITGLPDPKTGTLMLGSRILRPGDILTADQLAAMTFLPVRSREDTQAVLEYLPVYSRRVDPERELVISVWGREDKAPKARDLTLETYQNIPNEGVLKASDPEGKALTYTVTRQPRRGSVTLSADGTFLYTPQKNKVGVDSFTYTAADPAGNVSGEATVTVQIRKTDAAATYRDTAGLSCRFEAEWLRNTGIFAAEQVGGKTLFQPEKPLSGGQYLAMLLTALETPLEGSSELAAQAPGWLRPYIAAAERAGLAMGEFDPDGPISRSAAEAMAAQLLGEPVSAALETAGGEPLTRAAGAELLYALVGDQKR